MNQKLKAVVDAHGAQLDWWTGKDSNLRTSQGGTDLQSVGFNHSPTCPVRRNENNTVRSRVFRLGAARPEPPKYRDPDSQGKGARAQAGNQHWCLIAERHGVPPGWDDPGPKAAVHLLHGSVAAIDGDMPAGECHLVFNDQR